MVAISVKTDIERASTLDSSARLLRWPVCVFASVPSTVRVCVRSLNTSVFRYSSNFESYNCQWVVFHESRHYLTSFKVPSATSCRAWAVLINPCILSVICRPILMGLGVGLLSDSDGKSEMFEICWIIKAICRVDWRILWANKNESFAA